MSIGCSLAPIQNEHVAVVVEVSETSEKSL
jgi:hypothetical protein